MLCGVMQQLCKKTTSKNIMDDRQVDKITFDSRHQPEKHPLDNRINK